MSARVELLACETCGGGTDRDAQQRTRGQQLLAALHALHTPDSNPALSIAPVRCLWACKRSCAVHVRSPGRVGYVLCDLPPNQESAQALLDYLRLYAQSSDGAVPFRSWPQPLRGHFLCRTPQAAR